MCAKTDYGLVMFFSPAETTGQHGITKGKGQEGTRGSLGAADLLCSCIVVEVFIE